MKSKLLKTVSVSLVIVLMSSLFCGCNRVKQAIDLKMEKNKFKKEFFEAFDDRDVDDMYDLFSDAEKEDKNLASTIEVLFYYFDLLNLDVSKSNKVLHDGGYSIDDGIYSNEHDTLYLYNCVDEYENNYFRIKADITMIDTDEPDEVGVNVITVSCANSTLFSAHGCSDDFESNKITKNPSKYMKEVLDELFDLKDTDEYWSASYKERVQMGIDVLDSICESQMEEYGFSVVDQDSIHSCMYDDSYNFYPDVGFYFYNGIEVEFPVADERDEDQKLSIDEIDEVFDIDANLRARYR